MRHFHATSGKILYEQNARDTNPANQIYMLEYNKDGTKLAAAGLDKVIRLYDEHTKSLIIKLKDT